MFYYTVLKLQSCETDSIAFNDPSFEDQIIIMILINKAQKDCGLPTITF